MQIRLKFAAAALCAFLAAIIMVTPTFARDSGVGQPVPVVANPVAGRPHTDHRVHKVGNVGLTVTNYGNFGTQMNATITDPETGLHAPSCEYPLGSRLEYLFQGALWIGAIVDGDTLVSTGHDGWESVHEMFSDSYPKGKIVKRSTRPSDPAYSPDAVSEADYIATYYDTLTDQGWVAVDPYDGRQHIPLGLKIVQKSYSWSTSEYEDFVIFKYQLTNIDSRYLQKVFCGLYYDCDVSHVATLYGFTDDISGSRLIADPDGGDSILIGWSADNDGDPNFLGIWDYRSPRGAFSASLLSYPTAPSLAFNWWVSHGDPSLDWGPRRQVNNRNFGTGGLGTPSGDKNKYYVMSTKEDDYDQLFSAINYTPEGWLPPSPSIGHDLADGYDTRFLFSFGSVDLAPGDSTEFAFVVAMGDNFHRNPSDFAMYFDANNPQVFYNTLDFSDLTTNVLAARRLYRQLFVVVPGDADRSGAVDLADAIFLLNYIFVDGPAPSPLKAGDANGDCCINIADAVYLIAYLYGTGAAPVEGCAL